MAYTVPGPYGVSSSLNGDGSDEAPGALSILVLFVINKSTPESRKMRAVSGLTSVEQANEAHTELAA